MITVAIQSTCRMSGVILCKRRLGQRSWWRATNHSTPRPGSIQTAKPVACNSSLPRDGEKSNFRTRKKFGSPGESACWNFASVLASNPAPDQVHSVASWKHFTIHIPDVVADVSYASGVEQQCNSEMRLCIHIQFRNPCERGS